MVEKEYERFQPDEVKYAYSLDMYSAGLSEASVTLPLDLSRRRSGEGGSMNILRSGMCQAEMKLLKRRTSV
jgi:hypothetical protein